MRLILYDTLPTYMPSISNKSEKRPISWQFWVVDTSHNIHSKSEQMTEVSVDIRVERSDTEFSETTQPESILGVGSPEVIESSQSTVDGYAEWEVTPSLEPCCGRFYAPLVNVWRHYRNSEVDRWVIYRSARPSLEHIQGLGTLTRSGIILEFVYGEAPENSGFYWSLDTKIFSQEFVLTAFLLQG